MKVCGLAAVAAGLIASAAHATLVFDGNLGTLPTDQGWAFMGSYTAPMSVSGGQLTMGPTTVGGTTYWSDDLVEPVLFATETVYIEATVRLSGADFGNFSGYRRAGFTLFLIDDAGRWIVADVGDNRISIGNDDNRTSDPSMVFNMTSVFHTLRLEAGPTGGRLLVDGTPMLTLGLGSGQTPGATGRWGEITQLANANQIEVRHVEMVPAPGAMALMSLGGLVATRRRR